MRSLGGPVFSLICFALSLLWRSLLPRESTRRELAETSLDGPGFILLGSIVPLPMVDGGINFTWRLAQANRSVEQVDRFAWASWGMSAALLAVSHALLF